MSRWSWLQMARWGRKKEVTFSIGKKEKATSLRPLARGLHALRRQRAQAREGVTRARKPGAKAGVAREKWKVR
jgi:hypothetical protein